MDFDDTDEFTEIFYSEDVEQDIIDWYFVNLAADQIDFNKEGPMLRLAWTLLVFKDWLRSNKMAFERYGRA